MKAMREATIWHVGGEDVRMRIPLLLSLREKGFQVGAVGSEDGRAFLEHQIPYFQYTLKRGLDPKADRQSIEQLFHLFRQHQPDLVHGFDTKPACLVPPIAQKAGIEGRVRTIAGMGYVFSSQSPLALALRPIYRHLQRRASAAAQVTIFQNPDDRDYFYRNRMVREGNEELVLGSGIDIEELMQQRPALDDLTALRQELELTGKLVVTAISRLVATKGIREFLQAARIVCQQVENVAFLLVGPIDSEARQAISLAEVQKSAQFVRYLGVRNDIPAILSLTDLFVMPSYYREGVPRVLLEAGAMGVASIATHMPGCKEVVRDGWSGLLVPPRDSQSLAAAIVRLLVSEGDRTVMGSRLRSDVRDRFSLARVADAYSQIYSRVLRSA